MNPLNSIKGTIAIGLVLALITIFVLKGWDVQGGWLAFARWLHIAAGITWIGLLYYFNFVQVPALKKAAEDAGGPGGAGINKYVAPLALLWFRWAALVTWLTGAAYLITNGHFIGAFTLGLASEGAHAYLLTIGIGAWLGTIMLFNVWVLIWPNQKKVLGLVEAGEEEKAHAKKIALMASRTNTALSLPMLLCMVAAPHAMSGALGHGLWF